MATNHSSPMGNLCCKYSAVQGIKIFFNAVATNLVAL